MHYLDQILKLLIFNGIYLFFIQLVKLTPSKDFLSVTEANAGLEYLNMHCGQLKFLNL